jgi:hypothetical protein
MPNAKCQTVVNGEWNDEFNDERVNERCFRNSAFAD